MGQIFQIMKFSAGYLTFKISISCLLILLNACQPRQSPQICLEVDEVVKILVQEIKRQTQNPNSKLVLVANFVKPSNLLDRDIETFRINGYTELPCKELSNSFYSNEVDVVLLKNLTLEAYTDQNVLIITQPFYNKSDHKIRLVVNQHCGMDCGSIDLYNFEKIGKNWSISSTTTIGVM